MREMINYSRPIIRFEYKNLYSNYLKYPHVCGEEPFYPPKGLMWYRFFVEPLQFLSFSFGKVLRFLLNQTDISDVINFLSGILMWFLVAMVIPYCIAKMSKWTRPYTEWSTKKPSIDAPIMPIPCKLILCVLTTAIEVSIR